MLVPAILYKEQIKKEFQKYYYTIDMMYETGCMCNWSPEIAECPNENQFQYAIVDKNEKLIGYLGYAVDWYASKAYIFGLFSFDRGNILVGRDVFDKLEEQGIEVVMTEEAYTSGTSFLDKESPVKENYNKERRVYRGLFVANNGKTINADVNGAYQIMKKVVPEAFSKGIEGAGSHPIRLEIA